MSSANGESDALPPTASSSSVNSWPSPLCHRVLKSVIAIVPRRWRAIIYERCAQTSRKHHSQVSARIYRLPYRLALKIYKEPYSNEAAAYRYVSTLEGIRTPLLIDSLTLNGLSYLLISWVNGPTLEDVWDDLSTQHRDLVVEDLQLQFGAMRQQTLIAPPRSRIISNVKGGPIDDVRIPWADHATYATHCDFAAEIWPHLDMPRNAELKKLLTPLIARDDVAVVFTHGDLLPKNVILPVNKDHWLATRERLYIIDWECAGWKPSYWEALRATFFEYEADSEWTQIIKRVFPECSTEINADWRWRSESGIAII